jgi:hypothetical protein
VLPDELSPWGIFVNPDAVVKAVALASVVTWTVWLAKIMKLRRASAAPGRRLTCSSPLDRWPKQPTARPSGVTSSPNLSPRRRTKFASRRIYRLKALRNGCRGNSIASSWRPDGAWPVA